MESSILQLKFEIFPAVHQQLSTNALCGCVIVLLQGLFSGVFFHCLNVSIFMVSNNVHGLGSGLFAQT